MKKIQAIALAALVLASPAPRPVSAQQEQWEAPEQWVDIGTVDAWSLNDSRFYRVYQDAPFQDTSQFRMNQAKEYQKTTEYAGRLDGIGLETFYALGDEQQQERRKAAGKELKFLADFRQRIEGQVQRVRERVPSGWGNNPSKDMTVVGDCLAKLRTATSLDPSNPFAWHLYAYLARIVGDLDRSENALEGASAALDKIPADRLTDLRRAVALDWARLHHDRGSFTEALASVDEAESFGAQGSEPLLLRGLVAARTGQTQMAVELATRLKAAEVRAFPPNIQSASYGPDIADISAWRTRASNYLQSWILAITWIEEGNLEMAAAAFGGFSLNDAYPYAQRFWNDAGWIYDLTGRRSAAVKAWNMARINVPYIVYMVHKPYTMNLGRLTGHQGDVPFYLGFDRFFIGGNRLAYAAALVEKMAGAGDDMEKNESAVRALDEIEICLQTGSYAGQAGVLKAQVYYMMGDVSTALVELERGLEAMDAMGDRAGFAAVMQGLAKSEHELSDSDIANFFGQSGAAPGWWQIPEDLAARETALRQAYADTPDDANRRELARFLIRNDGVAEGRDLALGELKTEGLNEGNILRIAAPDLTLVLEADRQEGETGLALALVQALKGGAEDPWRDSTLWAMAGFICLDAGHPAEGRFAIERAAELDPGNQGLKIQLTLMR
jgi:tetratricopeptide (TPR) repeat protein